MDIVELRRLAEEIVTAEPARMGQPGWWRSPLLVSAPADQRFAALPGLVAPDHALPHDLLPSAKSVVVFFIPFIKDLVKENRPGPDPCQNWGRAYVATNDLIGRVARGLAERLEGAGFKSGLTPATHNFDETRLVSRWSHKHLAHLCHLGRFGQNCQMITPAGCAGRLGSLVTEAELGENPLVHTAEACLLKAGKTCGKCIEACPVGALSEAGFDRHKCWARLKRNRAEHKSMAGLPQTTHVCGKCLALTPCSFTNPVAG